MSIVKKNQIILIIGSIFVFLMFLSTYFNFINNNANTAPSSSSTLLNHTNCTGSFAENSTNAIIANYSPSIILSINKSFNFNSINENISKVSNTINNTLNKLNSTGFIDFEMIDNTTYHILVLNNTNAYNLQNKIFNSIPNNISANKPNIINILKVSAISYIKIPSIITFNIYSTQITQREILKNTIYNISIYPLLPVGTSIPVTVQGVINNKGLCQTSIRIIPADN